MFPDRYLPAIGRSVFSFASSCVDSPHAWDPCSARRILGPEVLREIYCKTAMCEAVEGFGEGVLLGQESQDLWAAHKRQ